LVKANWVTVARLASSATKLAIAVWKSARFWSEVESKLLFEAFLLDIKLVSWVILSFVWEIWVLIASLAETRVLVAAFKADNFPDSVLTLLLAVVWSVWAELIDLLVASMLACWAVAWVLNEVTPPAAAVAKSKLSL